MLYYAVGVQAFEDAVIIICRWISNHFHRCYVVHDDSGERHLSTALHTDRNGELY
jgi:hypothetical protein